MRSKGMIKRSGFTLIELLVVMAILGMLAALVGPALFGNLSKGQRTAAASQISNLESALDTYRLDVGSYPGSLRGLVENDSNSQRWNGPYIRDDEVPLDPWDNPYQYQAQGRDFSLISYGADVVSGGEGDDADIGR